MSEGLPHLPWLRCFEACARRRNFTAAGREIGLTQAAVSQQIGALEKALGVTLFRRDRRGVDLTAEGAAYLPHVQAAFATLTHSTQELFGGKRAESVTLIAPASFAALWLAPRLKDFAATHQGLALEISTMHVPADYASAAADLEIRFGMGHWPDFLAHRLTSERLTPVCAPASLAAADDWLALPLLSVRGAREMWRDWFALAGLPPPRRPSLGFDTFAVALEAARAGAGILLGSRPLIDAALAKGDLVRLSDLDLQSPNGHFLCVRADQAPTPARQATINWFLRQASAYAGSPAPADTA